MRPFNNISLRLFLFLSLLLAAAFGVYLYMNIRIHDAHLMDSVIAGAGRMSDVILKSIRHSMSLNRTEEVSTTIRNIGKGEGVDGIKIFNKKGEVMYSAEMSEVGRGADMDAEACYMCHSHEKPLEAPPIGEMTRIFKSAKGPRVLGLITPIRNEPDCYNSSCHIHPPSQKILGVLDVKMSLRQFDADILESIKKMSLVALVITPIIALACGLFIWYLVHSPVKKLIRGTEEVSRGNLNHRISLNSSNEIGRLAQSFNLMTENLRKARDEITLWSRTLEERVKEKTIELQQAQQHIIEIERMASLGKLSATVAHEINNPLNGILTYTKLVLKLLNRKTNSEEDFKEMADNLIIVEAETKRCGGIINNLLVFAKGSVMELRLSKLEDIIDKSLAIVRHHFELNGITAKSEAKSGSLQILCDPAQIEQALIALFINAVEAMPSGGRLTIATSATDNGVAIEVSDTGKGIPEDILPRIFEPFFTTKKEGKGIGLGLSVAYGIIKGHNGRIDVNTKAGEGTTFKITLLR